MKSTTSTEEPDVVEIAANADKPGGTVVEMAAGPREPGVVDAIADQRTTGEEERKASDVIESEGLAKSDALRRDLVVPSNWIDVSGDDANLCSVSIMILFTLSSWRVASR